MPKRQSRGLLASLGAPSATGFHTAVFIAVFPFATGFLQDEPSADHLAFSIHLFDLIGGLAAALALVVLGNLGRRIAPRSSLMVTAAVWFLAAGIGVAAPLWLAALAGPVPRIYFEGIPAAMASLLGLLLTFQLVTSGFVALNAATRALTMLEAQLAELRDALDQRVQAQGRELRDRMRTVILPLLNEIGARLNSGAADPLLSTDILNTIDSAVRPLSHELASADLDAAIGPAHSTDAPGVWARIRARLRSAITSKIEAARAVPIRLPAILSLLFVVPSNLYFLAPLQGLSECLPALTAYFTLVAVIGYALRTRRFTAPVALGVVLASAGVGAVMLWLNIVLADWPVARDYAVLFAFEFFLVIVAGGVHSVLLAARWQAVAARESAAHELERLILRLQVERNLQARQIGHLVHGKVQAQLQSIGLRLQRNAQVSIADLGAMAGELMNLETLLLTEASVAVDFTSALNELRDLWAGLCDIVLEVEPAADRLLHVDQAKATAVLVVVEEAATNAIKHGAAERITVSIRQADLPGLLKVVVANERTEPPAPRPALAGFGTKTYDAMTQSWRLEISPRESTLTATI